MPKSSHKKPGRDTKRVVRLSARGGLKNGFWRSWFVRHKPRFGIYALVTLVTGGILLGLVLGVRNSLDSDFTFSMYQGNAMLGVENDNARYSELFPSEKPIVLNFWAGQCPPCRAEMPGFQRAADKFSDQVVVFGLDVGPYVNLGSNRDAQDLLRELNIRYPAGYSTSRDAVSGNGISAMPTTLFITPEGKVFKKHLGLLDQRNMERLIEDLIRASS